MEFCQYFPIWNKLTPAEQEELLKVAFFKTIPAGTVIHDGSRDCTGLFLVCTGQLRAYILSPEGKELTVYRLFSRDICLFSASCVMKSIQFDMTIEAEKETAVWVIPAEFYKDLMGRSLAISNYTSEIMGTRFTDVMWLIEQILWKSLDKRLAAFLLEEAAIEATDTLHITHEKIAAHLGTAREVVTRMLKYFQSEGAVALNRGTVTLTDPKRLAQI